MAIVIIMAAKEGVIRSLHRETDQAAEFDALGVTRDESSYIHYITLLFQPKPQSFPKPIKK